MSPAASFIAFRNVASWMACLLSVRCACTAQAWRGGEEVFSGPGFCEYQVGVGEQCVAHCTHALDGTIIHDSPISTIACFNDKEVESAGHTLSLPQYLQVSCIGIGSTLLRQTSGTRDDEGRRRSTARGGHSSKGPHHVHFPTPFLTCSVSLPTVPSTSPNFFFVWPTHRLSSHSLAR